jgi:hypothetical protein
MNLLFNRNFQTGRNETYQEDTEFNPDTRFAKDEDQEKADLEKIGV